MKKYVIATIIALGLGFFAFANGTQDGAAATQNGKGGRIGIVLPSADHGWLAATAYFAQQKAKELGLKEGADYKIVTSPNVNGQANQIDELIALKCSAIVLLPHNDEVSVAAEKIIKAGIKLIVFDRKVSGEYTAYVGGDNGGIGVESAKYIGEKLGGKGTVAVMNTPSVGSVNTERVGGFKKVMAEKYPGVKLVDVTSSGYSMEDGLKMSTDMLTAYPKLDAVFSTDDEPSVGILHAIREAKRTDIKLVSGGGGTQTYFKMIGSTTDMSLFTATYSPSMIKDAIQVAYDILQGKTFSKDKVITPTLVDKANVSKFIDAGSPY